jgi:mRNA-degrading endonuclease YafQ of YafQ-DinJ toxin-antitoxin module
MTSTTPEQAHPWKVDSYAQFVEAYTKLTKKDARLRQAIDAMMDRVEGDPLLGDPKTGKLRGLRSTHVARHWVLVWELRPVIVNRAMLPSLQEVWFYDVYHHPE